MFFSGRLGVSMVASDFSKDCRMEDSGFLYKDVTVMPEKRSV